MQRSLSIIIAIVLVGASWSCGGRDADRDTGPARYANVDAYLASRDFKRATPNKVVFIGIDGASWWFIDQLIEAGKLPNLARIKREGAHASLRSVPVYMSPPAWTTMMTGALPHKSGVYTFGKPVGADGTFVDVNAEDVVVATVWDVASYAGRRVAAMNVPVTYPVRPVNGVMLSGMMTPKNFASPIDATLLRPEMENSVPVRDDLPQYTPVLKTAFGDQLNTFLVGMYDTSDDNRRNLDTIDLTVAAVTRDGSAFEQLPGSYTFEVGEYSPWMRVRGLQDEQVVDAWCKIRFTRGEGGGFETTLSPTLFEIDGPYAFPPSIADDIAKEFGYYLPSLLLPANLIPAVATESGEQAMWLYGQDEWDLFLRVFTESDHIHHVRGFGKMAEVVYERIDAAIGHMMEAMPDDATLIVASDHGFDTYEYGVDLNQVFESAGLLEYGDDDSIDFDRTVVYHNLWHLYLNEDLLTLEALRSRGIDVGEGADPRQTLVAHLVQLAAGIEDGGRAFAVELRELPAGGAGEPPDIEVKGTYDGYGVQFWNFKEPYDRPVQSLEGTADRWWHTRDGIFAAWGAGVKAGVDAGSKDIQDVAATMLYLLDLPLADSLDGRVMADVVQPRRTRQVADYAQIERTFVEEGVEREDLEKKLRSLGYIK